MGIATTSSPGGPDTITVTGNLVQAPATGEAITASMQGPLAVSGTISVGGAGTSTIANALTVSSGLTIIGGLNVDFTVGQVPLSTTTSQLLSGTSSTITMTGSGKIIFLNPTATESTCVLTPTSSAAATATTFTNGMEVTLVNLNASSATTITIPSSSAGANGIAITISGGDAVRLMYVAALQTWVHIR